MKCLWMVWNCTLNCYLGGVCGGGLSVQDSMKCQCTIGIGINIINVVGRTLARIITRALQVCTALELPVMPNWFWGHAPQGKFEKRVLSCILETMWVHGLWIIVLCCGCMHVLFNFISSAFWTKTFMFWTSKEYGSDTLSVAVTSCLQRVAVNTLHYAHNKSQVNVHSTPNQLVWQTWQSWAFKLL